MTRTETDSLGSIEIDAERYWGPQTERARRLFRIGGDRFPPGLIRAVGLQKQAAALANLELGELPADLAQPIAAAARDIAETLDLKAVAAWTTSGSTVFRVARERPFAPILALTPNRATACRLALVWGVHAVVTKDAHDVTDMAKRACKFAAREGIAAQGDRIVVLAGIPFGTPGATNAMRIAYIEAPG